MVKRVMWAVIALFIGAALIFMGARECIVYVTKSTVSLNTAPFSDFSKVAAAEGEIACVLGSFATMTEEEKVMGVIPSSKRETVYYLVETLTRDEIVKIENGEQDASANGFVYVVAAATDEMKAALDANLDGWIEYDDGKTDEIPAAVHFEGKLWKQPKNDDYIKYRDDFAAECGLDKSYIAEYRAQDTKIKADCFAVLGIGVVCFLFGIIDSLLIVRKFRRRNEQY